jgi:lysyl-tRNA synthetase, class II
MADSSAPPTEQVANLLLDDVTGEMVSKTELKKRKKAREREAEKAKKAAAAPAKATAPKKKTSTEADEKELTPSQYFEARCRQVLKLKETKKPDPYPHKFHVNYELGSFAKEFGHLKSGEAVREKEIRVAARIHGKRSSGAKLIFYDVKVEGHKLQVMCQGQEAKGDVPFEDQHEHLRRGDIIGIVGFPGRYRERQTPPIRQVAMTDLSMTEPRPRRRSRRAKKESSPYLPPKSSCSCRAST